jgi:hypothetical protein
MFDFFMGVVTLTASLLLLFLCSLFALGIYATYRIGHSAFDIWKRARRMDQHDFMVYWGQIGITLWTKRQKS